MRFYNERNDILRGPLQYNIIGHDFFDFRIIEIIKKITESDNNQPDCSYKDILAFNNGSLNLIKEYSRNYFQNNGANNNAPTEQVIQSFLQEIKNRLNAEKRHKSNKIKTNAKRKIDLEIEHDKDTKNMLKGLGLFGSLAAISTLIHPVGWVLIPFYWCQGSYILAVVGGTSTLIANKVGLDKNSIEIKEINKFIDTLDHDIDEIINRLEYFEPIKKLIQRIDNIKNNKQLNIEDLRTCQAYNEIVENNTHAHSSNLFVLFSLCKYHIEVYNYCYRKVQGGENPHWISCARGELVKCIQIISKQSINILRTDYIDIGTKLLFLVDIIKVLEQYKASYIGNQEGPIQQETIERHCVNIFKNARQELSNADTTDKIRTLGDLAPSERTYFEILLRELENPPIENENNNQVYNFNNTGQLNVIVGDGDANGKKEQINGWTCTIL